ncbi:unnamed protein product [Rotaria sp. Silwood1]|nr:unnamed protein product [Rotaria sp. Silwood1]
MEHDWWSQAFLSGTNTIIHGRHPNNDTSQISHIVEYQTSQLSNDQSKIESFQQLHRILQFLRSNIVEGPTYLLRRHHDEITTKSDVYLYEVVNEADIKKLTFVTRDILNQLIVSN